MKKTITTALLCALAGTAAQAQTSVLEDTHIFVTPKSLTTNAKATITSLKSTDNSEIITIYDEKMKAVKSFSLPQTVLKQGNWEEIATVTPTGANIRNTQKELNEYLNSQIDVSTIKNVGAFANTLNQVLMETEGDLGFTGFIDSEKCISCYSNRTDFYLENFLGRQYPRNYYRIENGKIYNVSQNYSALYDESAAVWEKIEEAFNHNTYTGIRSFQYTNENASYDGIKCTQSLFNDDDTWECLVPIYEQTIYNGEPWQWDLKSDGVVFRRNSSYSNNVVGMKVVDEHGTDTGIYFDSQIYEVYSLNGQTYFKGSGGDRMQDSQYETLYTLENTGNSIPSVRKVSQRKLTQVGEGVIDVNVGKENGNVLLTNMGGSLIDRRHTNGEQVIRLNTRHLPKGIYNVTLQRDGHTVANEKVMVK
ncbi:MAG: hypothetical protein NC388_07120 [Clostridium sp.]|nr:hypothetical protein [Clostridium sp.]